MNDPLSILAAMRLEDGNEWGAIATDWQWDDAKAFFNDEGPRWHFITRPRGGSKSTDLAGIALSWLATVAPPGARGYVIASDRDQGAILVDAASGLVDRTPELRSSVMVGSLKITAKNGATLEVLAADGSSAFGLRPSLVIADEAAQWGATRNAKRVWTAITSALNKVPNCKFAVLTSAGEPSHWIYPVLLKARKDPEHWRVSETPGPLPWVNLADLEAQGLRDSEFQMLHLNRWVQSEDRLVSAENLAAAAVLDGDQDPRPGISYRIGCDLGFVNDRSVVAVCHREPTGPEPNAQSRVVVDNLKVWRGTRLRPVQLSEVEDWLVLVAKLYNNARIHCDPSEARGLLQRLQARGVRAEAFLFTTQSVGRLGQALHLALKSGLLWIPRDADLLEELGRVRLIPTGIGQARLDHDSGQHDDRAVAIGIATAILMEGSYGSGAAPIPRSARSSLSQVRAAERQGLDRV